MAILLSRTDQIAGSAYDSIKWAFTEHVKEEDRGKYNFALLHGNEDSPWEIEFFVNMPHWNSEPDYIWTQRL